MGCIYAMLRAAGWEEALHFVRSPRRAPKRRGDLPSGPVAGTRFLALLSFFLLRSVRFSEVWRQPTIGPRRERSRSDAN